MEIYTLTIDEYSPGRLGVGLNTSETEPLGGRATTTGLSSEVPQWSIDAGFDSPRASQQARELLELVGSLEQQPLPISDVPSGAAGYWIATSATREPRRDATPRQNASERVSFDLSLVGTRQTHLRAVETAPSQPDPGHEFGTETDALVGLPAAARQVEAVDATTAPEQRAQPDPVETRSAEHGDVDCYDLDAIDIDAPVLLYDLAYERQGDVDVGVWDDDDSSEAQLRVYDTAHEFSGSAVFENGLLRVRFEADDGDVAALEAEEYEAAAEAWVDMSLPETDWEPLDVELTRIGRARVAGRVTFEAVAGDEEGDVATVGLHLDRGAERVWVREVAGSIPAGVETLLEPIAAETVVDTDVSQTIVSRREVSQ